MATYTSQVAAAYPHTNVAESFKLAATHWRLGNHVYFPSIGTGGPCVPLANKYLLLGARHPGMLTIATDAVRYDSGNPMEIAARMKQQLKPGDRVAVLGICYRGDIRVYIESPHLKFARELVRLGVLVGVHDPYYTDMELREIMGGIPLDFPDDLRDFQFVYVGANHGTYTRKTVFTSGTQAHTSRIDASASARDYVCGPETTTGKLGEMMLRSHTNLQ